MSKTLKSAALIFIVLFIPRLWIIFNSSYTFYSDDAIYAILAKSWTLGNWGYIFHPTWPPLYPALSAVVALGTQSFESALRATSLFFGTALIIPLFILLRHTMSQVQAISYSIALALFTPLLTMSVLPLSDSLSVFLIISGLVAVFFAFYSSSEPKRRLLLLASCIFGLVYLTRTEGTMFFFFTLLYLLTHMMGFRTKKYILTVLLFIAVFIITISPYVIASRVQLGEWSLSPKFSAQIQQGHSFALNSRGTTWAQEVTSPKNPDFQSPYFRNGTGYLLERLYYFMRLYPEKQVKWQGVFMSIFPAWMIVIVLAGAAGLFKSRNIKGNLYLIFILAMAIPVTIFSTPVSDVRYLVWTIPVFLYFFYLGIGLIVKEKKLAAIFTLILVLTFPGVTTDNLVNPKKIADNFSKVYNRVELKEAGFWIKDNSLVSVPKVMMRHEGVEFYSEGETIYIPQISYEEFLSYAGKNNVDFIVAWEDELAGDQKLHTLMENRSEHPGLKEVYSVKGKSLLIIYTLLAKQRTGE